MDAPKPWYVRARDALVRFWRTTNPRLAALRDLLVAGFVVLSLLGVIWLYTGQDFPEQAPLVVVESGSMMHGPHSPCLANYSCGNAFSSPFFGRVGTIDPGDLVLVKRVDSYDDVETAFGHGDRDGYGGHGDVLVYERSASGGGTPVIHRAMLLVIAEPEGCVPNAPADDTRACTYRIPETCDEELFATFVLDPAGTSNWRDYCRGSREPITLALERGGLFLSVSGYPCLQQCPAFYTGFLTKGDNNPSIDQPMLYPGVDAASSAIITCCPVQLDWVVGKARGEIPWFGLIKLAIYGNQERYCGLGHTCNDPTRDSQWTIFRATAPWDIWLSLFVAIGLLIVLPMATDHLIVRVRRWRKARRKEPPQEPPPEPAAEPPAAAEPPTPPAEPPPGPEPPGPPSPPT